ncbi:MAG: DNA polymerase III subunit chi [gamma proteobacterium symbiont of Bathyaustriella thionipta]|nr:DNA polymerase III subunit chi [gamma proteobacterium symbiont of Bathyaustriella thionipta]
MTRIDFYIHKDDNNSPAYSTLCRLINKIWNQQLRGYIVTQNEAEAQHLDRLLWTFQENSFIPHGIVGQSNPQLTPILLGWRDDEEQQADVLINLAAEIPAIFSRYERVVEIIDQDSKRREAGRKRFRFYKDRGYPLNTHQI